jgi:hypothetical protein
MTANETEPGDGQERVDGLNVREKDGYVLAETDRKPVGHAAAELTATPDEMTIQIEGHTAEDEDGEMVRLRMKMGLGTSWTAYLSFEEAREIAEQMTAVVDRLENSK